MPMDPNRLTAIPLFSSLSGEEARRLATFATETSAAEGQILMKEGDYSTELIGIEDGTASVERDGREIAKLGKGDLIGEMGLLSHEPRSATVVAASPMFVFKLTHWEVRRMSEDIDLRIVGDKPPGRGALRRLRDAITEGLLSVGFKFDPTDPAYRKTGNESRYTIHRLPYEPGRGPCDRRSRSKPRCGRCAARRSSCR